MRPVLLVALLLAGVTLAEAQQNYDASLIPKGLLSYASSVVRDQEESIEVKDLNNAVHLVKKAVTVLNKNGDDNARIVIYYDKNDIIRYIKGTVYNAFGKQTGKFSERDFLDQNVGGGADLFAGERVRYYLPAVTEYPYTIVYEYEEHSKQTLFFDDWEPISNPGESVEKSAFTFSCKPDFPIRYKENNIPDKVIIGTNRDKEKTYSWQAGNLKALKDEDYSPYYKNYIPIVQIASEKFSFYGIDGTYNSWKDLGKWIYDNLIAARQGLPPETIEKVKEMTKDIADPKLKAKKIYEYMQGKTHYISVQVGIGGWQPFLASDVDRQNYGDCKALVNYTQALLKAVNIPSYYCVVTAGDKYKVSMPADFPCMEGNHIILCLPFKNDTTWADCTSQTIPFGYLGDFTDDRTVLACTPDGGKLLHTPKYTAQNDLKTRKADFIIDNSGAVAGTMTTNFKGIYYDYRDELNNDSKTERDKILQQIYPINNLEIENYDLKQEKSFDPSTTENIKLRARDYATFTDGKYYFLLNPVNRVEETPRQVINRQNEVYITRGKTETDDVNYTIPAGYHLEKDPLNVSLDKPFGKFTATMELKGDQLSYKRKFQLIGGTYSKDTYQELVDFYQNIVDADSYMVSLVKN